jgi:hypothetical protein
MFFSRKENRTVRVIFENRKLKTRKKYLKDVKTRMGNPIVFVRKTDTERIGPKV